MRSSCREALSDVSVPFRTDKSTSRASDDMFPILAAEFIAPDVKRFHIEAPRYWGVESRRDATIIWATDQ